MTSIYELITEQAPL